MNTTNSIRKNIMIKKGTDPWNIAPKLIGSFIPSREECTVNTDIPKAGKKSHFDRYDHDNAVPQRIVSQKCDDRHRNGSGQ
jgi:hypothetical protein